MIKAWVIIAAMSACGITHATASSELSHSDKSKPAYRAFMGSMYAHSHTYKIKKIALPMPYAGSGDQFIECGNGGDIDSILSNADICRRQTRCLAMKEYKALTNWYHDDLPNYIEVGMRVLEGESS